MFLPEKFTGDAYGRHNNKNKPLKLTFGPANQINMMPNTWAGNRYRVHCKLWTESLNFTVQEKVTQLVVGE